MNYETWINLTPPDELFHYTPVSGFYGICETVYFRATQIDYLNDSSEYIHGQNIFIEELEKVILSDTNNLIQQQIKSLINQHNQYNQYKNNQGASSILSNQPVFIASFTTEEDDLSQWRAYCSDGGIMMGFKSQELSRITQIQTTNNELKLIKCIYEDSDKRKLVKELIEWFIDDQIPIPDLLNRLAQLSCAFKDSAFEPEEEWRLVHANIKWPEGKKRRPPIAHPIHKHMKFFNKDNMLIPYIELSLNPEVDNDELYDKLDLLEATADEVHWDAMNQQEENGGANFSKSWDLTAEYRELYMQIGDRTYLPKSLCKILIGPGDYDSRLLQSSIHNYVLTKINVLREGCIRDKSGGQEERYTKEAFWENLAGMTKVSEIPYRQKL